MRYLLDTNACIAFLNDPKSNVGARLQALTAADVVICDVVLAELLYGARRSQRVDANLERVRTLQQTLISLPFDSSAAEQFGRIRAALEKLGTPIGPFDTQIAAIAMAHGLTVVTNNAREFERVEGLNVEDWQ